MAKRSFYYTRAKYFNELPTSIGNSKSYMNIYKLAHQPRTQAQGKNRAGKSERVGALGDDDEV